MKHFLRISFIAGAFFLFPLLTLASEDSGVTRIPTSMILKTGFRTWEINPSKLDLFSDYQKTAFVGLNVSLNEEDRSLTAGLVQHNAVQGPDSVKIRHYLEGVIAPDIYREKTPVSIDMDKEGVIHFEGTGLYGRKLDIEAATKMIEYGLRHHMTYVNLPLLTEDPEVTILNPELEAMGIKEFISGGETDFSNSPSNRITNINVGLSKFFGHVIKPGEEFVFGDVLGPVDGSTGFLKELVIKGDKTLPEYGGGLCQVSTTAYRAAMAAGYPITSRRNHSYAVSYYKPLGLDATVYPPTIDMKFMNDTPDHILMQSFTIDSQAYYNFYGTKTYRKVEMIGPYYSSWTSPPAQRVEYSDKLKPGERQVVGHAVPGVSVTWYRKVTYPDNHSFLETIYSKYQARPDYFIVSKPTASSAADGTPSSEPPVTDSLSWVDERS